MGTKFAPVYANLVLGYLEEKLYTDLEQIYYQEFAILFQNSIRQ